MEMAILFAAIMFGVVTAVVAANKGRDWVIWFLVGLFLGPFGLILAIVTSKNESTFESDAINSGHMKKCPFCAELVKFDANFCKHCGKELPIVERAAVAYADSIPPSEAAKSLGRTLGRIVGQLAKNNTRATFAIPPKYSLEQLPPSKREMILRRSPEENLDSANELIRNKERHEAIATLQAIIEGAPVDSKPYLGACKLMHVIFNGK